MPTINNNRRKLICVSRSSHETAETAVKKISIWVFASSKYPPQFTDDKSNDSSMREGIPLDALN